MAATRTVWARERSSRAVVISRATVRAEGVRNRRSRLAASAQRRRVAHSATTREQPRKPRAFSSR